MSERTDERPSGSGSEDADLDELLDDDFGSGDVGGVGGDLDGGLGDVDATGGGLDSGDDVGLSDDELGVDVDALTGEPGGSSSSRSSSSESSSGFLSRLVPSFDAPNPLDALPSTGSVLLSFGVVLLSALVAGNFPVLGWIPASGVLGIVAGSFALGLASGERRYLELALAGAVVTAPSFAFGFFQLAIISGIGFLPFAVFGGLVGLVAAVAGHYFGRDFRAGLTRGVD